ncbi:hypothetical protein BH11ARM1_BH11ARM1_00190 [soil metagenome]
MQNEKETAPALKTSSPIGHEEVLEHFASQTLESKKPPEPTVPEKVPTHSDPQILNPKNPRKSVQ